MIFLTILKIFAVILLVVLNAIIILVFIPLKYRLIIKKKEDIDVVFDYFIFKCSVMYNKNKQFFYEVQIFNIIKIASNKKESKNASSENNKIDKFDKKIAHIIDKSSEKEKFIIENKKNVVEGDNCDNKKLVKELLSSAVNFDKKIKKIKWELPSFSDMFFAIKKMFSEFINNIKHFSIKNFIREKLVAFKKWIKRIFKINEIALIKLIIKEFAKNIKEILPRTGKCDIEFGTGEPFSYGVILAIVGPIITKFNDTIKFLPNPKKKILNVDIDCTGIITLKYIVIPTLKLFFNKEFRTLLNECNEKDLW